MGHALPRVRACARTPPLTDALRRFEQYFALLANAQFLLRDEEHFFEQLREKRRHYMELGKEIDFFIVPEPAFVYANPNEYANVGKPCAALISSDETWITFMKLRIDKVRLVELGQCAPEEALKSSRDIPDFSKPERWTAPYLQYSPGWWRSFVPEEAKDVVAVN